MAARAGEIPASWAKEFVFRTGNEAQSLGQPMHITLPEADGLRIDFLEGSYVPPG